MKLEKSITRECALDLLHNKQRYIDAHASGDTPKQGGVAGEAWTRFITINKYQRQLMVYALGGGLTSGGEWMLAYSNGNFRIPVKLLLTKK